MYIILADSQNKQGEKVALVDRTKFKTQWWTENIEKAVVFTSKAQADLQCAKLRFNNPHVYTYENGKKRLGQIQKNISNFGRLLDEHCSLWHDDDWYESHNSI